MATFYADFCTKFADVKDLAASNTTVKTTAKLSKPAKAEKAVKAPKGTSSVKTKLVVGLGQGVLNPHCRHAIGAALLDEFVSERSLHWRLHPLLGAYVTEITRPADSGTTYLAWPLVAYNLSGAAVATLAQFFEVAPRNVTVVHDDYQVPLSELRARPKDDTSEPRGNNALKSVQKCVGNKVKRCRLGIMPDERPADVVAFLLSPDVLAIADADRAKIRRAWTANAQGLVESAEAAADEPVGRFGIASVAHVIGALMSTVVETLENVVLCRQAEAVGKATECTIYGRIVALATSVQAVLKTLGKEAAADDRGLALCDAVTQAETQLRRVLGDLRTAIAQAEPASDPYLEKAHFGDAALSSLAAELRRYLEAASPEEIGSAAAELLGEGKGANAKDGRGAGVDDLRSYLDNQGNRAIPYAL